MVPETDFSLRRLADRHKREPIGPAFGEDRAGSKGTTRGFRRSYSRRRLPPRKGVYGCPHRRRQRHNLKRWPRRGRRGVEAPTNLIVTSAKGLEARASAEFKEIALLSGIRKLTIDRSAYDGIIEVDVENPKALLTFITDFVRSEPFKVRFIMRIIPVDRVVDTKINAIVKAVKELSSVITPAETFRITIEARDSPYSDKELIDAIADAVDRKVNLDSPDKIVLLEVFGEYSGVSVISPQEIVSILKLKRAT
jgi:tRNA acetyltransferase TAN1